MEAGGLREAHKAVGQRTGSKVKGSHLGAFFLTLQQPQRVGLGFLPDRFRGFLKEGLSQLGLSKQQMETAALTG